MAVAAIMSIVFKKQRPFSLAVSPRQSKNFFLRVLCASAVKILFWTSMILSGRPMTNDSHDLRYVAKSVECRPDTHFELLLDNDCLIP